MGLIKKFLKYIRKNGIYMTAFKIMDYFRFVFIRRPKDRRAKKKYFEKIMPNDNVLIEQKNIKFFKEVKISVLVPLYNTPLNFLKEMIESVMQQTYSNWELCLADGSDSAHNEIETYCKELAQNDKRIIYKKLEQNRGISENTNCCIEISTGDYLALFDHDDYLHPSALYEVMVAITQKNADMIYTDEVTFEDEIKNTVTFHFKPDYAPDNLRANNYICHLTVFKRTLMEKAGTFRKEFDGSQDHDFVLRLTENAENIVHISKILYFWRVHPGSVSADINAKYYAIEAAKKAVESHTKRIGYEGAVAKSSRAFPTIFNLQYEILGNPLVSIIIPNKNHLEDIRRCIKSIMESSYKNFEVLIVDNNSNDKELRNYYNSIKKDRRVNVIEWNNEFNYSEINNYAVNYTDGEYLLFLNNDTEVITKDWIEKMLMHAQRKDVGAVGAKLYYDNKTIQHAGVIIGMGEDHIAGHAFHCVPKDAIGYMGRLCYAQNYSAVTAACLMMKKTVFEEVSGFNKDFKVAYNDIDLCLKIREKGYLIVWTPEAELYHYESQTRGYENTKEKKERFNKEVLLFRKKWQHVIDMGDPYYNKNLSLDSGNFKIKIH